MLIGIRSDSVHGENLLARMQAIKALGYDFMELVVSSQMLEDTVGSAAEGKFFPKPALRELCCACAESMLPIRTLSFGSFPRFGDLPEEKRAQIVSELKSAIWLARSLGAHAMLVAMMESKDVGALAALYARELKGALDFAEECCVELCFEPIGRLSNTTTAHVVRALDHPAARMYYDMGNCIYAGEEPVDELMRCALYVSMVHIKGGENLTLYDMPLYAIAGALERSGFEGDGVMEIEPGENNCELAKALPILRALGY